MIVTDTGEGIITDVGEARWALAVMLEHRSRTLGCVLFDESAPTTAECDEFITTIRAAFPGIEPADLDQES